MNTRDSQYLKRLGARISARREAMGFDSVEFAKKIEITRMQLYRIEHGLHAVSVTTLRKISRQLETPLSKLADD